MPNDESTSRLHRASRRFQAPNLLQIAMPMGGIGAGCICLNGIGGLQDFAIRNAPATSALPDGHGFTDCAFALLHVKGRSPRTLLLEGPMPPERIYDQGLKGQGYRQGGHEGLPRFQANEFEACFPFGRVELRDDRLPLTASVTGWSPFIPNDDVSSGAPSAVLDYTFRNRSDEPVEFEFSFHASSLAMSKGRWSDTRSSVLKAPEGHSGGGVLFSNVAPAYSEEHGSAALYLAGHNPLVKAAWFRGGWFDGISVLWREVSTGAFQPNEGRPDEARGERAGGSLLVQCSLAPGESVTLPVIIAWHFPNSGQSYGQPDGCGTGAIKPLWHPFYTSRWKSAAETAQWAASNLDSLRARTWTFADALFSSSLPKEALDAISSNLAILKSPTVLRQANGNVWGWEGCFAESGCCHGSCTHVWNYAQAMPALFPALERTLREQELRRSIDERGHVSFRSSLPDGPAKHDFHAAADGQLGGILKLWRDYEICGDREWLAGLYPQAKRSLDYCIAAWDPGRTGLLSEPHHNTYDIEFWGPDGMCGTIYTGALSALALIARAVGHPAEAAPYEKLAKAGARQMSAQLFNGEYYQQNVTWTGLRERSLEERIAGIDPAGATDEERLLRLEGPKYQYGAGCLADGVIGAWMAALYGVPTPLDRKEVASTLRSIVKHNFRTDLSEHACLQRPGYALGTEGGLLLCTWPRGEKLTLPFPYSDEVWTGIEYQVASHLILEGMADEGLAIVRATRARYDGRVRNPFNEYECGNYYARAMASYALVCALTGFRYSAPDATLYYGPWATDGRFQSLFSTAGAWGVIRLNGGSLAVTVKEGSLRIGQVQLALNGQTREIPWNITIAAGATESLETAE